MINKFIGFINWMLNLDNMNYYCDVALEAGCERSTSDTCDPSKCPMKNTCEIYKLEQEIL